MSAAVDAVQATGVLAFASAVWYQLRQLVAELGRIRELLTEQAVSTARIEERTRIVRARDEDGDTAPHRRIPAQSMIR